MTHTQQPEALNLEEFRAKVTRAAREPLLARIAELEAAQLSAIGAIADTTAAWVRPVSELLGHISDVLPDNAFDKIDTAKWNAVSALVGAAGVEAPAARRAPLGAVPQWDGVIKPSDFTVDAFRSGGSGWVPRPDNRVRITHRPTGFFEEENAMRSAHANKAVAWQRLSDRLESLAVAPKPPEAAPEVSDAQIKAVFLANGFTVKEGLTDLKPYVYQAARALLAEVSAPAAQGVDAQLVAFIEKVRDFTAQAVRVGSKEGEIRWDIEFGHYGAEVRGKTLRDAITKAMAAQAKQGGTA